MKGKKIVKMAVAHMPKSGRNSMAKTIQPPWTDRLSDRKGQVQDSSD